MKKASLGGAFLSLWMGEVYPTAVQLVVFQFPICLGQS